LRVAVLGAGAIGAYVGAALGRADVDVSLVARGRHLEALKEHGVRVRSPRGDFAAHPPATNDPAHIGVVDYVFLGLKAHDYADAGELLKPLLGADTAVIAAQNGIPWWYFHGHEGPYSGRRIEAVDPGGRVSAAISPERAIGCVVYASTELIEPGVVRHLEGTRFSIGEPGGSISSRCTRFSEAMIAGGLKCPVETEIRDDIWIKLMGNAAFNPLSVLTRATMAELCAAEETRIIASAVMAECLSVAAALGCTPEISIERRLEGAARVGDHKTSMLQDLEAGKRLELAPITGAVLELAELTATDVPTIRTLHGAVDLFEKTGRAREAAASLGC
jgi:2-dehydropantoate 2-reductase